MVLCPLWPSPASTVLCSLYPLYDPLFLQQPSILSTARCLLFSPYPLYGPLSSLRPSIFSTALCLIYSSFPLYESLSPLGLSVLSTALCLLYSPLSPLWPSVPSEKQGTSKTTILFSEKLSKTRFVKTPRVIAIAISDNRDYRDNHDYHSREILRDNHKIAIIALTKKVAIITSNKKCVVYWEKGWDAS
jgi:hypothetical protein